MIESNGGLPEGGSTGENLFRLSESCQGGLKRKTP